MKILNLFFAVAVGRIAKINLSGDMCSFQNCNNCEIALKSDKNDYIYNRFRPTCRLMMNGPTCCQKFQKCDILTECVPRFRRSYWFQKHKNDFESFSSRLIWTWVVKIVTCKKRKIKKIQKIHVCSHRTISGTSPVMFPDLIIRSLTPILLWTPESGIKKSTKNNKNEFCDYPLEWSF